MSTTQLLVGRLYSGTRVKLVLLWRRALSLLPSGFPLSRKPSITETLNQIGGPNSRTGIFELTEAEFNALKQLGGGLTQDEIRHIRPIFNTRDVYPYATILPAHPNRLIWLPESQAV